MKAMTSKPIMFALGLTLGGVGICSAQSVSRAAVTGRDSIRHKATLEAIAARLNANVGVAHDIHPAAVAGGTTGVPTGNPSHTAVVVSSAIPRPGRPGAAGDAADENRQGLSTQPSATVRAQNITNASQVTVAPSAIGVMSPQRAAQVAADIKEAAARHLQDSLARAAKDNTPTAKNTSQPPVTVAPSAIGVMSPQRAAQVAADIRAAQARHLQDSISAANNSRALNSNIKSPATAPAAATGSGPANMTVLKRIDGGKATPGAAKKKPLTNPPSAN